MLPLLGYLSIPFLVPLNKFQNLINVIHKGSIICNDWALKKDSAFSWVFFVFWHVPKERAGEGNLRFLNPSQLTLTAPIRGMPTTLFVRVGRPCCFDVLRTSRRRG